MYLQLLEREATTGPNATVVFDGRASHNGAQLVHWARSNSGGLCETCLTTAVLATGLYPSNTDQFHSINIVHFQEAKSRSQIVSP
jgi:hypothetical protein